MNIPILDKHIIVNPSVAGGKPRIKGHRITVQDIAIWHERMGKTADEISTEYNLSLAEIHAALSYYFDHQEEINANIRSSESFVEDMRKQNRSVLMEKLTKSGRQD